MDPRPFTGPLWCQEDICRCLAICESDGLILNVALLSLQPGRSSFCHIPIRRLFRADYMLDTSVCCGTLRSL